jgi:hypothetical protein
MKKKKTIGTTKGKEIVVKHPSIGSGKISRRIFAMYRVHYHPDNLSTTEKMVINPPKKRKLPIVTPMFHNPSKSKTKQLQFSNQSTKIVFLYWNRLGHPFVKHREIKTKATARSLERIGRAVKQHGKDEVIKGIDRCYKLFSEPWFQYRLFYEKTKLSLHQFFRYDSRNLKVVRRKGRAIPVSWFKECLKGNGYLKNKYSIEFKDKHPVTTKRLLESWEIYDGVKATIKVKNDMIEASKIVKKYSELNDLDIVFITRHINRMLNEYENYKPKHSGYLTHPIFWNEKFPKELERYGIIAHRKELKDIDL